MKKFGFGCMRLKMNGDEVDYALFSEMIDRFLAAGCTYFDTARVYLGGQSEVALSKCLAARYPREAFQLTDKLSSSCFQTAEEVRPYFEDMLRACGVEYFDYLLVHSVNSNTYDHFTRCRAFEQAQEFKAEGKVKHVGFSFHDSPEFLEMVLREHPEVEVVQLQLNYLDMDSPNVQSRKNYEVCERYGKKVIVMEPVKGGSLVNLPRAGKEVFDALGGGSYASYAIRFAASFPNVIMVLSGMNTIEQMEDNLSYMADFQPLTPEEQTAVAKVHDIIRSMPKIECTSCKYCVDGCPQGIEIPTLFALYNRQVNFVECRAPWSYAAAVEGHGKAGDCIRCGKCEKSCPQKLPIRELLQNVAAHYEKK